MKKLPENFTEFTEDLLKEIETVEGYLLPDEIRFLILLAACPTAPGEILEIGSFKGKSTILLAKAAALADNARIHAVDPMTAPSKTDPDLSGRESSLPDFQKNIRDHGVADKIELHQKFSSDLAETWDKPIRLLWIDGDHTYKGTKADFKGFADYLADGAIVAIHDSLYDKFDGGIRVFMEDILLSPNFGECGYCRSMAWAQFHADSTKGLKFRDKKLSLYRKLTRLMPYTVLRDDGFVLEGFKKRKYAFWRSLVPHGAVDPNEWLKKVSINV